MRRQLSKGRAARRKLNDLRKKIESRKDRALARRRERRRARSGAASPAQEDLGYASDGGSPRKEPLGAVPARALPWEGAASTGALLTPTKAEAPVLSRDRLPSGDMTPLDVSEEELEAELSESDDDSLDEDEGPTPDARAVQAAILAALGDVDRSVRALACGVAVAALLCVDVYISSPTAGVAGMVAALGPLRAAATVIAVVGAALQVDGVRRASLRMSGAAVARATGARPPAPGKRHPKSPGRAGARKRAGSKDGGVDGAPALRGLARGERAGSGASRSKRRDSLESTPTWTIPRVDAPGTENSWRFADTTKFQLRGSNYLRDKVKAPSARGVYECVAVHVFQSPSGNMPDMLAKHARFLPDRRPGDPDAPLALPRVFAFNISVPTEAPSMRGWKPHNPCWVILIVMRLTDESAAALRKPEREWTPGLRLARDWVDKSEDDPYFSSRLKGIFMCAPLKGEKLPSLLDKWNGKPVLMAASGGLGRRPGISTFHRARDTVEVGLNIGESFSYMGRGAVYMMIGKLATLDCDVCFTVEGRADDELPEVVLGASTFSALKLSEKFANLMPPTS